MTERHDLELLRWHWGSFYVITLQAGEWRAERKDGDGALTDGTAAGLRALICADYASRPVTRHGAQS